MLFSKVSFCGMGNVEQMAYFTKLSSRSEASHYPVGGGNVERRRYEDNQGWSSTRQSDELDKYYDRQKQRDSDEWLSCYEARENELR